MGLSIYNSDKIELSSETFENPLRTYHDGKNGSADSELIYVRNDDISYWYQNVELIPIDNIGYDDTVGEYGTGFSVKLAYGTVEPLPHEWDLINSGDSVVVPNDIGSAAIADTTTYFPIWVRINVPGNTRVQNKTDILLRLQTTRRPVTGS